MGTEPLTVALRETLAVFDDSGEPRTTPEVARELDLGRRSTYERLERLVEHDRLATKKVGANARVWWQPGEETVDEGAIAPESLLEDVLDDAEVGVFVFDEDYEVAWINHATERYFGLDRERVVGRDRPTLVEERIAPLLEDPETFAENVLATDDDAGHEQFECRVTAAEDRDARWLEHRSEPIESGRYAGGRVELYYDVTEQKRSEVALHETERRFRSLVRSVEEYAIFMLDPDGHVRTWNEGAERIKGYDREEIVGEHVSTFYTEEEREARVPERTLARAAADGTATDEGWRVRADGTRFWAHVTITALYDDTGGIEGYAKVTRDTTDRREREQELRQERDLVERILETVPVGIGVLSTDGHILRANERADELLGITQEETGEYVAEDRDIYDADGDPVPPEERPYSRVLETGDPVLDWRCQIERPDGERRWLSVNAVPLTNEDGEIDRIATTGEDITPLKDQARRLEAERDDLERELDEVFERVSAAFYALDDDWRFTYVNDHAADLLGRSEGELLEQRLWEAFPRADEYLEEPFRRAMGTQEPMSEEVFTESRDRWLEVDAYPSATGLSVYLRDVTDRKGFEETLRDLYDASRELFHAESAVDVDRTVVDAVTGILDIDGIAVYRYDEDADELFPAARTDEVAGMREELPRVPPDDSSVTGHLYATGESRLYDDVHESPYLQTNATAMHAGVFAPMGDHGIVVVGSRDRSAFDERTAQLVELLAATARAAYDRVERERDLEEYRRWNQTLVENFPNGAVALVDQDMQYVTFGGTPEGEADVTREDLQGSPVRDSLPEKLEEVVAPAYEAALDGEPSEFEATIDDRIYQFHFVPVRDDDDEVFAATAISQEITERKERERELRDAKLQLEAATEAGAIGTWEWDLSEDRFVAGPSFAKIFGIDPDLAREGLAIERFWSAVHEDDRERTERRVEAAIESCGEYEAEYRIRNADGDFRWVVARGHVECDDDGNPETFPGALVDITERKENERELEESRRRYRTLVENFPNGAVILFDEDLEYLIAGGSAYEGLDVSIEDLEGDPIHEHLPAELIDTFVPRFRAVFEGQASEFEFEFNDQIRQFRVFPVRDDDGEVFAGMVMSQDVTERNRRERQLERQRERLVALNNLNDVVHDITEAVIEQSTREEIEAIVCERLADVDSYEFAWIGDVDSRTQSITKRVEAGVDGYLEAVDLSADPDDPAGQGPAGRAVRNRETQVTQDARTDPAFEPWRDRAAEYGYRSTAAIPIVHGDTLYGLLGIYADRPKAFGSEEREVIARLGEVVGHAIAAVQRKRALMSDEVIEIEFTIPRVTDSVGIDADLDGRITFDRTVPTGDDEFLQYGTVEDEALVILESLVDGVPHFEAVSILKDGPDASRFELRMTDPPIVSVVASHGGAIRQATFEDGDYHMTIHLPPSVEARRIIDAIHETYPQAELLTRRQVTRSDDTASRVQQAVTEDLTERQRTALEAAVYSGFFEWPRETAGEEVAESLGVAPPTFHQHLRKAQRKVFESLFPRTVSSVESR